MRTRCSSRSCRGGIGALTSHLCDVFTGNGGELRLRSKVDEILVADGRVAGVRLDDGSTVTAPIVISGVAPDLTINSMVDPAAIPADIRERFSRVDHRGSYLQMHFALDGIPEFAAPYELLNDPAMQSNIGIFSTPEELQQQWEDCRRGIVPADPAIALQIPSVNDPGLAPEGKHAASAFSLWFPVEDSDSSYGEMKVEMGRRVIEKLTRLAPNFEDLIIRAHHVHPQAHGHHVRCARRRLLPRADPPRSDRAQPARSERLCGSTHSRSTGCILQCRMPWRTRHHVHPGLQRRQAGAGRRVRWATARALPTRPGRRVSIPRGRASLGMGLTVAVTGPTGEIGISAVTALDRDPVVERIIGMARRPFNPAGQGWTKTEYRQGDITVREEVDALVADADVVIHLAFIIMGSRDESSRVNLAGTRNVFEATVAAERPRRLVYTSSVAAYGYHSDNPTPITEDVPPRGSPEHYYSEQKAACEAALAEVVDGSATRGLRIAAVHRRRARRRPRWPTRCRGTSYPGPSSGSRRWCPY